MSVEALKREVLKKVEDYKLKKNKELDLFKEKFLLEKEKEFENFKAFKDEEFKKEKKLLKQKYYFSKIYQLRERELNFYSSFIEKLYELFLEELRNLKKEERKVFYRNIISKVPLVDLKEFKVVEVERKNCEILKHVFKEMNLNYKYSIKEGLEGFILKDKEENIFLDFSLKKIAKEIIDENYDELVSNM